jgi:hypothetical protein
VLGFDVEHDGVLGVVKDDGAVALVALFFFMSKRR